MTTYNLAAIQQRAEQLEQVAAKAYDDLVGGRISEREFNEIMDSAERQNRDLQVAKKTRSKALSYAGSADSSLGGTSMRSPAVDWDSDLQTNKKVACKKWRASSPLDMSQAQMKSLFEAGRSGVRFGSHVGVNMKDAGSWMSDVGMKAGGDWTPPTAIAEGTPGSMLPPELIPNAFWMRYEPTRLMEFFLNMRGETQSVTWLTHYGNTNPAAAVAELDLKPDLGPLVEPKTASYSTIACTASVSKQM